MNKRITIGTGLILELIKNDLTAKVVYSPRTSSTVLIPRSIEYQSQEYLITTIGRKSFENNKTTKRIRFPDDSALIYIEKNAFKKSSIESIEIPPSVQELQEGWCKKTPDLNHIIISPNNQHFKYIDNEHQIIVGKSDKTIESYDVLIFGSRDIKKVKIPDNIKTISSYAFQCCHFLETVEISENSELQKIGKKAFASSLIRSFFIPSKVEEIQCGVLSTIYGLNILSISSENRFYKFADIEKKMIVGKSDKNNDNYDVLVYGKKDIKIAKIPPNIKRIDEYAFYDCIYLKTVEITENSELRSIGKKAFFNSRIKSIYIPSTVQILEEGFLYSTPDLKHIIISPHNQYFKYFDDDRHLIVGKSDIHNENYDVIIVGVGDIETVKIPSYIKTINSFSFSNCENIKTIEIQKKSELHRIGKYAFSGTKINNFTIPKSVEIIESECFYLCKKLKKVTIEKGSKLHSISSRLFSFCSKLKTVEIPEESKIKTIEKEAFFSCPIQSLYIPSSVEELKENWCNFINKLKKVSISSENKIFGYADEEQLMIVSKSDKDKENYDVLNFACRNITVAKIPDNIKYISSHAFSFCRNLTKIEISENSELNSIGENAFEYCSIDSIFFPQNLQVLGEDWNKSINELKRIIVSPNNPYFKYNDDKNQIIVGKSDITKNDYDVLVFGNHDIIVVNIPSYIQTISSYAFNKCVSLERVNLSKYSSLKRIGNCAFGSTQIRKFTVPKNVEIIGQKCFSDCTNLETFEINENSNLKIINESTFDYCIKLKTIEFNDDSKIEIIKSCAFEFSKIEYLFIPASVLYLEDEWCSNMANLKRISISNKNPKYKYLDDEQQLIVRKSDNNNKYFDVICFANRKIHKVVISPFIKYIESCAFSDCKDLTDVIFPKNSELRSFGSYSFQLSAIQSLTIPKKVETIDFWAFEECISLNNVEFLGENLINRIDFMSSINLKIISLPNLNKLEFCIDDFNDILRISPTTIITISAGSLINFE